MSFVLSLSTVSDGFSRSQRTIDWNSTREVVSSTTIRPTLPNFLLRLRLPTGIDLPVWTPISLRVPRYNVRQVYARRVYWKWTRGRECKDRCPTENRDKDGIEEMTRHSRKFPPRSRRKGGTVTSWPLVVNEPLTYLLNTTLVLRSRDQTSDQSVVSPSLWYKTFLCILSFYPPTLIPFHT